MSPHARAALLAPVVVAWTAATLKPARRGVLDVVVEVMNPLSVAVATHGLGRRVASEAEPLEGSLQDEFSRGLHRARVEAIVDLLGYCDQLVTFVEQELTRLGDDVLEDIAAAVRHECAAMRAWLARPMPEQVREHAFV